MKLIEAIAFSTSNKAEATNDEGNTIVVQQRYADINKSWYHIWFIKRDDISERDTYEVSLGILESMGVDPDANYWLRIGK